VAFSKRPCAADQSLIEYAADQGVSVTVKQLATWRQARLLPGNIPGGGLGQGRGSTSAPPPDSYALVTGLGRLAGRGKRPADLALLLFAEGSPVPESAVRAAFRTSVETTLVADSQFSLSDALTPDEQLDLLSAQFSARGRAVTLVPARARRIDERISRALGQLPVRMAELDRNPDARPLTAADATLTVAAAAVGGGIPLQDIGALLRAMNPPLAAHPFASLIETAQTDVPDSAARILREDGSLSFIPSGDPRALLRTLADTEPLDRLASAWHVALKVKEWALGLCQQVEEELESGQLGSAVEEWVLCRQLPSGLSVIETLRERRWTPSKGAASALLWLFQRQMFAALDVLCPGCQWHLVQTPGVVPPPVRELICPEPATCSATGQPVPLTDASPGN